MWEEVIAFLDAQMEAEKKGEHEFVCPICGGRAFWGRAKYNNHLHSGCEKCGMVVHE